MKIPCFCFLLAVLELMAAVSWRALKNDKGRFSLFLATNEEHAPILADGGVKIHRTGLHVISFFRI